MIHDGLPATMQVDTVIFSGIEPSTTRTHIALLYFQSVMFVFFDPGESEYGGKYLVVFQRDGLQNEVFNGWVCSTKQ